MASLGSSEPLNQPLKVPKNVSRPTVFSSTWGKNNQPFGHRPGASNHADFSEGIFPVRSRALQTTPAGPREGKRPSPKTFENSPLRTANTTLGHKILGTVSLRSFGAVNDSECATVPQHTRDISCRDSTVPTIGRSCGLPATRKQMPQSLALRASDRFQFPTNGGNGRKTRRKHNRPPASISRQYSRPLR